MTPGGQHDAGTGEQGQADRRTEVRDAALAYLQDGGVTLVIQTSAGEGTFLRMQVGAAILCDLLRSQACCMEGGPDISYPKSTLCEIDPPEKVWLGRGVESGRWHVCVDQHNFWYRFVLADGDEREMDTPKIDLMQVAHMIGGLTTESRRRADFSKVQLVGGAILCSHVRKSGRFVTSVLKRCPDIAASVTEEMMRDRIANAEALPATNAAPPASRRRSMAI